FELRKEPLLVDRKGREAATEMIVDAALENASERELHRRETAAVVRAFAGAPQKLQHHRLRKLWRAAYAAVDRVDYAQELVSSAVEVGRGNHDAALGLGARHQPRHQRAAVLLHAFWVFAEHALDLTQEVDERRLSVTGRIGKVSAAPERLSVRGEEHRQRPAAVLTEVGQSRHVDLVDVGTFFAIYFDVHKQIVHDLRGGRVLEALV